MSKKVTINNLLCLQEKFAQRISLTQSPETDGRVTRVYFPLYEISAVLMVAVQQSGKKKSQSNPTCRTVLTMVKNRLKEVEINAQRLHYVPGYRYAGRVTEVNETKQDVQTMVEIVDNLLS